MIRRKPIETRPDTLFNDATRCRAGAAGEMGPCVVKAKGQTGKRGKAGGSRVDADPAEARSHAGAILGMEIGGHRVEKLLIEAQVPIARELYAAILNDPVSKGPLLLFSTLGGMDVEEAAAQDPQALRRPQISIRLEERRGGKAGVSTCRTRGW